MKSGHRSKQNVTEKKGNLELAFDVGHSSIGWAVLGRERESLLGCGAVIFQADDCLASARRAFRRQRRHIRSTRQRVERLKILLEHVGALNREDLNKPGCAWPWLLAARVLRGGNLLTWPEMWDVLRWYAHNRGYDGNRAWSATDAQAEADDIEKLGNARALYEQYGTHTMAETFCSVCGLDPLGSKRSCNVPGDKRPKALNAAFPREDVRGEVLAILKKHFGSLRAVNEELIQALMVDASAVSCDKIKLPLRYRGGFLFGQLVPRFENRIIATCPIMYERVYQAALQEAGDSRRADMEAEKAAKVPSKKCHEFHSFRWAMQMANIQVAINGNSSPGPLIKNRDWRAAVNARMQEKGYLTPRELKDTVREVTGGAPDNLDQLLMHPDAEKSLLLDPVMKLITSNAVISRIWPDLPERQRKIASGKWRRGKSIRLSDLLAGIDHAARSRIDATLQDYVSAESGKKTRRKEPLTLDRIVETRYSADVPAGRAPYHRAIMLEAVADVMERGVHPMEEGGALFRSDSIRQTQLRRAIENQTNNHLVRHRLLILDRLHRDIIREYADGQPGRIGRITIEVNRELKELSGKTAKEVAQDIGQRLSNFKGVSKRLEKAFEGKGIKITPGLIRKARVAEDLDWTCPFTGKGYDEYDLLYRKVDIDHIIPRSMRPSDSLDSVVVTYSEINKWKGQRTALEFIEAEQSKSVLGLPNLSIMTLKNYTAHVEKLETFKGHDDDKRRKLNRKRLLLLRNFVGKEFVPRDLTQTSQLVRLGAQVLQGPYLDSTRQPIITSVPGGVTGAVRRAWNLVGCLSLANPEVLDEHGGVKTKTEIRDITHLHHALDACVLAFASRYLPRDGGVWQLLVKRRLNADEQRALRAAIGGLVQINAAGEWRLNELPDAVKQNCRERLAERRIVQHIPKEMTGLRAEQNAWRVVATEKGDVLLRQRMRQPDGSRPLKNRSEKIGKVIGLNPGKLLRNKAALIIRENYGLALDPEPTIIPFHKVRSRVDELRRLNDGKMPRILRNGDLIHVLSGKYEGEWRVFSIKNNASGIALDIGRPDVVRLKNGTQWCKINVLVASLMKIGLNVLATPYTGVASCPTISST